jgi:hypothetical protein
MRTTGLAIVILAVGFGACGPGPAKNAQSGWKNTFAIEKSRLSDQGKNPYFILEPGNVLSLFGPGKTLTITVLNETEIVDGVMTRIVEERETEDGQLIEVSRNFFAIDPSTGDLFYFGEDVDIYKEGKIVSHEGAWRSGAAGATFGLMLPGAPSIGDKYYQENAPGVALDRAEIVALDAIVVTPGGTFKGCLRIKETSALETGESEKIYAPGLGLVKDDEFRLMKVDAPGRLK